MDEQTKVSGWTLYAWGIIFIIAAVLVGAGSGGIAGALAIIGVAILVAAFIRVVQDDDRQLNIEKRLSKLEDGQAPRGPVNDLRDRSA